jgi:hypothetical protein
MLLRPDRISIFQANERFLTLLLAMAGNPEPIGAIAEGNKLHTDLNSQRPARIRPGGSVAGAAQTEE